MAGVIQPAPRRSNGGKCLGGCCGCAVVLAIAGILGGMLVLKPIAEAGIQQALKTEAPADSWDVKLDGAFAPIKMMLGGAADVHLHGVNAQVSEGLKVSDLTCDIPGFRLDKATKKPTSSGPGKLTLALSQEMLQAAVKERLGSAAGVKDFSLTLADGKLNLAVKISQAPVTFSAKVAATPLVKPPATLVFVPSDVKVDVQGVPAEVANRVKPMVQTALKSQLSKAMRNDLSDGGKVPLTLSSAKIEGTLLKVSGTIDVGKLASLPGAGEATAPAEADAK